MNQKVNKRKGIQKMYSIMGIICFVIAFFVWYFLPVDSPVWEESKFPSEFKIIILMTLIVYGIVLITFPLAKPLSEQAIELQEIENELDLLSISHSSLEERSEKLFKHHHFELKRYYDENLKQSSWIFLVGIACILIGFVIIGITLYFLIANSSNELENKIIVASVGAIGAILSNFIAVIYLKMHAETVKALTEFHNRFVNTHHFYFSNFLLSKIQNEDKREDALVELALKINGISPKAPAQGEENK
ncbi:TRADD-N-associated membrane domain-containing protein [Bacillus cereus]|uniref:TRADD-N-associated membrane domain-containing protein n=1 Tax=Bacillus cereus TaxID=1396 RepID=UPI0034E847D3